MVQRADRGDHDSGGRSCSRPDRRRGNHGVRPSDGHHCPPFRAPPGRRLVRVSDRGRAGGCASRRRTPVRDRGCGVRRSRRRDRTPGRHDRRRTRPHAGALRPDRHPRIRRPPRPDDDRIRRVGVDRHGDCKRIPSHSPPDLVHRPAARIGRGRVAERGRARCRRVAGGTRGHPTRPRRGQRGAAQVPESSRERRVGWTR